MIEIVVGALILMIFLSGVLLLGIKKQKELEEASRLVYR